MFFYQILIALAVFGFLTGLAQPKAPFLPFLMSALVVLGYGILLLTTGIWAAQCWDCAEYEDTRGMLFGIWIVLGAVLSGVALLSVWAGAGLTALFRMLHKPIRPLGHASRPPQR